MSINLLIGLAIPAALIFIAILITGFAFARMYKRSTREVSLVKTGTGGRKVIIDGGTLVIPVLHEITRINMKTTRLEVSRTGQSALITLDRMRVDVGVEFYVIVKGDEEGIARAAQTLGARTFDERALREMIEGKLVDGLRAVAAKMNLDDLHENRSDFVQQVQTAVSEDLKKNGLELETVSLTALDQTPLEGMDENNVFNALGMQNQAQRIADSRKHRAEIEAEADVAVVRYHQEAEVQKYEIEQSQEEARVNQSVKMEEFKSREISEKARKKEESEQASEEARIARTKSVELAEQDREIAIAAKSEEESVARGKADLARAEAIKATESIETERQVAEGERKKRLTILAAEEEAERSATSIRVSAKAERDAAEDRAASMRELAEAEADQITIKAGANKTAQLAEAEGNRALIESENSISAEIIDFRLAKARLDSLPGIIAEMVKPAEKIGGITIHKVDGLSGGGYGSNGAGGSNGGNGGNGGGLVNQAFDEMRQMAFQLPAISAIGKQVGLNMDTGLAGLMEGHFDATSISKAVADALPATEGPSLEDAKSGTIAAE